MNSPNFEFQEVRENAATEMRLALHGLDNPTAEKSVNCVNKVRRQFKGLKKTIILERIDGPVALKPQPPAPGPVVRPFELGKPPSWFSQIRSASDKLWYIKP